jgi:Vitamin B12 dependent methionine synthase, activation domain
MHIRTDFEIPTEKEDLINALGTRLGRSLKRPRVMEEFEKIFTVLPSLIEPRVGWDIFPVKEINKNQFLMENGIRIDGGPMMDVLKESTQLVVSLCTIGDGIENKITELQDGKKMMAAVLLDAIGSWIVGTVHHQFEFELKEEYRNKGMYHNINFAAGSTDWPIEDQRVIFDLLEPEKLEMKLTDVLLMIPQKSLSSLFGVSDKKFELDHVKRCEFCQRKDTCRMNTVGGI